MNNLIKDLYKHEFDSTFNKIYQSKNVFSKSQIDRLTLSHELQGHEGCVNCLEWNNSGTLLASGSDDLKVMIWDPFKKKLLNTIETKHRGNIFSVKFLPSSNDSLIASAAADMDIYIYDINKNQHLNAIRSHQNRVKKLATVQDQPFLFWSCGEDGFVLQHDIRCTNKVSNILLSFSKNEEAKCIALNEARSEMIGVGCNDPYAKVYDRRMIKLRPINNIRLSQGSSSSSPKCLFEYSIEKNDFTNTPFNYYVPGHLPRKIDEYRKRMKTLTVTHLTFSPNGSELLVNLGGEQLYLFDVLTNGILKRDTIKLNKFKYDSFRDMFKKSSSNTSCSNKEESNSNMNISCENIVADTQKQEQEEKNSKKTKQKLPPKVEELKSKANLNFEEKNYVEAIEYYNKAINIVSDSPILYGNRAAAFMKRNWDGDIYAALLDCYAALSLDITHLKSHFRLAKCLSDLKWYKEANDVVKIFVQRFPDYAKSTACENLIKEIDAALYANEEKLKKTKTNEKRDRKKLSLAHSYTAFLNRANQELLNDEDTDEDISSNATDEEDRDDPFVELNDSEDDYDITDYFSEDISSDLNECKTGDDNDENSDSNEKEQENQTRLRRSTRKRRCDTNNNRPSDESILNSKITSAKIKKKRINSLIKSYNQVKSESIDFKSRYCGHCNVATDIKEAAFIGEDFICAGSDDGSFFIWDKRTTNLVKILKGDESIVNCIQPHPTTCLLATSGIDPIVRIWTPRFSSDPSEPLADDRIVSDVKSAVLNNQVQMNSHPFEFLFLNLNQNPQNWDYGEDSNSNQQSVACRPS